jgi:spermidine synthase
MGFTLRAVLDLLPHDARVTVAELVPQVVEWNRSHLGSLAGDPLQDSRVRVIVGDVAASLRAARAAFDVVLLDTDNGPEGTTQEENEWLYGAVGLAAIRGALRPGGVLAVWSVFPSEPFTKRLGQAGFEVEVKYVRSRGKKGNRHVIWVARDRGSVGRDRGVARRDGPG